MANDLVIKVLKTKTKSLNLSSRKITDLPEAFARLTWILTLKLNNNYLSSLPSELQSLRHLTELNLGNNVLEEVPSVLKHLCCLKKLFLYGNKISHLPPEVLEGLPNLVLLNLNHNSIKVIPPEIKRLCALESISLTDNQLEQIPAEFGLIKSLTEINFNNNKLTQIPQQLYNLSQLRKLYLARNNLTELPEGVLGWKNLKILDVAGNCLSVFPVGFQFLALKELFFEGNCLVPFTLMESIQEKEALLLKELSARLILKESTNKFSVVSKALPIYPELQDLLSQWGQCALCAQPFLTTWLECVQFINLWKVFAHSACLFTFKPTFNTTVHSVAVYSYSIVVLLERLAGSLRCNDLK
ncbi:leucine-rich repeat-containing protein 69 isoform X1 [Myxocyprinus asiaticus]|uniref:leucine-rich repeat-containing protein 69 isoform X1 n=1 Tax=Myxocyprinus asiaticus TaxID=70543 RepID=UPI002222ED5B|nr:leucine-rich repeat-containing protein 69 isoform X1 [Myxocyprinus asiaticus]